MEKIKTRTLPYRDFRWVKELNINSKNIKLIKINVAKYLWDLKNTTMKQKMECIM